MRLRAAANLPETIRIELNQMSERSPVANRAAQPKTTSRFTVRIGGEEHVVLVTHKRVKNLNLRVRGDGTVVASAPARTTDARIQAFLDSHAAWIERHVARKQALSEARGQAADRVPELIPLWGELVSVRELFADGTGGKNLPSSDIRGLDAASFERLLLERYRDEVARALPAVTERFEAQMGVRASRWQVRIMKTRWGSCTPRTAAIRVNARLAAYPPACLEFVVAHELCHLMEPSHNARFHALLDRFCPANRELSRLLRHPA